MASPPLPTCSPPACPFRKKCGRRWNGAGRYSPRPGHSHRWLSLPDLHPPQEVVPAYHEVARAMERRDTTRNDAKTKALRNIKASESDRSRAIHLAEAERTETRRRGRGATSLLPVPAAGQAEAAPGRSGAGAGRGRRDRPRPQRGRRSCRLSPPPAGAPGAECPPRRNLRCRASSSVTYC